MAESTLTSAPITPTEEPRCREEDVQLLRAFADVPSVSKGWIFPCREGVRAALQCAGKNLSGNTQRKWLNQFQLNEASLEAGEVETGLPIELTGTTMVSPSPSGGKILMVRPGKNDKTSIVLEVWNRGKLLQEIEVSSEMHGPIYNDGWFGHGAVWSPNETEIAYVAESPVAVRTPNWALAPEERGDVSRTPPATQGVISKSWRGVGEFQDDWGELNTRKRPPAIYVLNIASGKVFAVLGAPEDTSCGQPQWSKAGDALVFVGWSHIHDNFPGFPRRLGMVYCYNRPCSLYAVAWPQPEERDPAIQAYRVTPPHVTSAFSPRFSPDGDTLIFLSQQSAVDSGVHNGTPSLLSLSWGKLVREIFGGSPGNDDVLNAQCLVDVVDLPSSIEDFQGLYCSLLPDFPFICDGSFIVATVQWRSYMAIVAIDVGSGDVSRLSPANGSSWYLVAAGEDWLIASETRPDCPSKLFCCHIAEREKTRPYGWSWSRVGLPDFDDLPKQLEDALNTIDTEVFQVKPTAGDDASRIDFEVVVLRQKNGANASQPGVVVPHGGPHSCYSAIFGMPSFLAACGWCVMLVNYRGSTGFGERFLQSLPGNIGTNDVEDCVAALDLVVGKRYVDASKVAVFGGSHGGFLSAHLVGQYPDRFRAAILRNPVCNISLMVSGVLKRDESVGVCHIKNEYYFYPIIAAYLSTNFVYLFCFVFLRKKKEKRGYDEQCFSSPSS